MNSDRSIPVVTQEAEARGDTSAAIDAAKRWVTLDPCSGAAHRILMSLFLASGDRAEAVRQFQQCEERLRSELDVTPSEDTLAHHIIAASAAHLERMDEAKAALARALNCNPDLTLGNFVELFPVSVLRNLDRYLEGLRKAGLRAA